MNVTLKTLGSKKFLFNSNIHKLKKSKLHSPSILKINSTNLRNYFSSCHQNNSINGARNLLYIRNINNFLNPYSRNYCTHNDQKSVREYLAHEETDLLLKPRITVIGVGGGGSNAVNNMIDKKLVGVEYIVCNTDTKSLRTSKASYLVQLGPNKTRGLGAGSDPEVGKEAASESIKYIMNFVENSNMVFITAGMGGGTGSGAAPVIANACRSLGILTVAIVTLPFQSEGKKRMEIAKSSLQKLIENVDTCIVVSNEKLTGAYPEMSVYESFEIVDNILYRSVKGITDLIIKPGIINCDFADVKKIMSSNKGLAFMGYGEASGTNRASLAIAEALQDPLLDTSGIKGAKRVLVNITCSDNIQLREVNEISNTVHDRAHKDALIIFGVTLSEDMEDRLSVSVIFTDAESTDQQTPPQKPLPKESKKSTETSFFDFSFLKQ